jgi:hypothetical protein
LTSEEWRAKATSALVSAVDRFFVPRVDAERGTPKTEASAGPAAPVVAGSH